MATHGVKDWDQASAEGREAAIAIAQNETDAMTFGMIGAWLVMIACVRLGGDSDGAVTGARRFTTLIENGVAQLSLERSEFFHGPNGKAS